MTNNEILRASLLDIIFEKRNKDYGAYALRQGYNHRLLIALVAAMSTILLFILINALGKKDASLVPAVNEKGTIVIRTIEVPRQPDKPEEIIKPHPVVKAASVKSTSLIDIRPDDQVKITMPEVKDLDGKVISTQTLDGQVTNGKAVIPVETTTTNGADAAVQPEKRFIPDERDPEFPGGPEALKRFLNNNLRTPVDLETGEKKMVQIRFKVDKDGSVSTLEIVNSAGTEFDREVMRVCKKMPRWRPAIQNGISVPVSYVLPVTFIGAEQ